MKEWKHSDDVHLPFDIKLFNSNSLSCIDVSWTCRKALKKGTLPPMSNKNKLEQDEMTDEFTLTDLKDELVAKDLLFL